MEMLRDGEPHMNIMQSSIQEIPPNEIGVFAVYSHDNCPMPVEDLAKFIAGPMSDCQDELAICDRKIERVAEETHCA